MSTNASDRRLVWIVIALLAAVIVVPTVGMGFGTMGGWHAADAWGHMWSGDGAAPTWVVAVSTRPAFLATLLAVAFLGYHALAGDRPSSPDDAVREPRRADARSELSHEGFEQRRGRLESDRE